MRFYGVESMFVLFSRRSIDYASLRAPQHGGLGAAKRPVLVRVAPLERGVEPALGVREVRPRPGRRNPVEGLRPRAPPLFSLYEEHACFVLYGTALWNFPSPASTRSTPAYSSLKVARRSAHGRFRRLPSLRETRLRFTDGCRALGGFRARARLAGEAQGQGRAVPAPGREGPARRHSGPALRRARQPRREPHRGVCRKP